MEKTISYSITDSSSAPRLKRRAMIILYGFAVFLFWFGQYIYMPTLPLYIKTRTDSLAMIGIVLSMYGLWQAIVRIPLGIASDWVGRRKPFMLIGIALVGIGAIMMGLSPNVLFLLIGRALTGIAAGTWVLLVVSFGRLFPTSNVVRAIALISLVGAVGRMVATSTTGFLNNTGGYALAFFVAAGAAGLALLAIMLVPEEPRSPQRHSAHNLKRLFTRKDILFPSLLCIIIQYGAWSTVYGFLPILAKQLGATDVLQSALVTLSIAVIVTGNAAATAIVHRTGPHRLVYVGFVSMATGIGIASMAFNLPLVFVALFFIGLAWGVSYPLLLGMSIEYVDDAQRATAMGIHQAIYGIGMFSGPWISGMLANALGIRPMLGITSIGCLVLGVYGTYKLSRERERQ